MFLEKISELNEMVWHKYELGDCTVEVKKSMEASAGVMVAGWVKPVYT